MTEATAERTAQQQARIEQYAADLVSGRVFTLAEASQRSRRSFYGAGPLGHRAYADALAAIARFAGQDDWHAHAAHSLTVGLPLYNTEAEFLAKLAGNFAAVTRATYFDAAGHAQPNPGRRSSYEHETTLFQALNLYLLWCEISIKVNTSSLSSPGWCAQALIERENVQVYQHVFPNIHAEERRCEEINKRYR